MSASAAPGVTAAPLELWADADVATASSVEHTGSAPPLDERLERLASLGIRRVRIGLPWARTEADWRELDRAMQCLRELGVAPIVCLAPYTDLLDPHFPATLAAHARAVAERFAGITTFTPVNAVVATARRTMLGGLWPPQPQSDARFVRALLQQVQATVLAMRAVRAVVPAAALLQTDDLGLAQSTLRLRYQAEFMNLRRWLAIDLLCGRVERSHRMWRYLRKHGASEAELMALVEAPCAPQVIGLDLDLDSDRFLDDRLTLHPRDQWSGNGRHRFADVAAVTVQGEPIGGFEARLREAWQRYGRPLAVTRVYAAGPREAQMRWLGAAWQAALTLREHGIDVRAVTASAAFGVREVSAGGEGGRYEPSLWDLRASAPRRTALAVMAKALATEGGFTHPVLDGPGGWERETRFTCLPHGRVRSLPVAGRPLLITGAGGMLGNAFARVCEQRGLAHCALDRSALDIADPAAVDAALERWRPWAVINAIGFARIDEAEHDANILGPLTLAAACARAGVRLVVFSSDQVFDGTKQAPYVESDAAHPLNAYGEAQLEAEGRVLAADPHALVLRTAALFGPWESHNAAARLVAALREGRRFAAAMDHTVSPTYAPDLAHAALDMLIDGVDGVLHLANCGAVTWDEFLRLVAQAAGLDDSLIDAVPSHLLGLRMPRPVAAALGTERCDVMPTLEEGIAAFVRDVGPSALVPPAGTPQRRRARAGA